MFKESDIMVQILAGGMGANLLPETRGRIPKSLVKVTDDQTILDIVVNKTKETGLNRIVYALSLSKGCFGIEIYKHLLQNNQSIECTFEYYGGGNAKSVQKLAEYTNFKYPIFLLCSDMLLPWDAIKMAVSSHKENTFTWVTSSNYLTEMERYHGLKIRKDGAVIYDTKVTPEGKFLDDGNLNAVTKAGAIIIDPHLLIDTVNELEKISNSNQQLDIFWDIMPFLERNNWKRLINNKPSLINAVVAEEPVIDMGSPERLLTVREYLKK